ncbi:GNAT family N-acetyltransferase [Falsirhodobacter sp. 20TX0035]|uniref:GNAT family N-acetyltransferase n=1 Tax=Falsirhodobacter sp. 20TX0035 TaxID=3022019 RepID=UPI002330A475|nr:GNAT family N-acetyltransferase [Falsirhodobacter sp. 20TX0035]MDB6454152.1 GNAT family N-acetyltransferase [Falsirhodobacter sp. 20TX0035]
MICKSYERPSIIVTPCIFADHSALRTFDEFMGDRRIDMQQGTLLVAAREDEVVGYVKVAPSKFMGWPLLSILCVAPAVRRQGVGRKLVESAVSVPQWLRLYTSTEASKNVMRALLQTCGAREVGFADDLNMSGEREILFRLK